MATKRVAREGGVRVSDSKTELLVIGTVHQNHFGGFSFDHLRAILDAADPDVLCVEMVA
jgi:pheromone shutdown protein TraB